MEATMVEGPAQLIPVQDFPWTEDYSWMRSMTCANHPTARYLTKNPYWRTVHIIKYPEGMRGECPCPFNALVVIVAPGSESERDLFDSRKPPVIVNGVPFRVNGL